MNRLPLARRGQIVEEFRREELAFEFLSGTVRAGHAGRYVAIHGGRIVDSDESRPALVSRFFAAYGDVPVYIGFIGKEPIGHQLTPFDI